MVNINEFAKMLRNSQEDAREKTDTVVDSPVSNLSALLEAKNLPANTYDNQIKPIAGLLGTTPFPIKMQLEGIKEELRRQGVAEKLAQDEFEFDKAYKLQSLANDSLRASNSSGSDPTVTAADVRQGIMNSIINKYNADREAGSSIPGMSALYALYSDQGIQNLAAQYNINLNDITDRFVQGTLGTTTDQLMSSPYYTGTTKGTKFGKNDAGREAVAYGTKIKQFYDANKTSQQNGADPYDILSFLKYQP